MKVLKYFFLGGFFILCVSFTNAVRNDKQFRPQNSVTRPPLVHRVRERLTSLIAHNHEHLFHHHHNYHQYVHQNHWSLLNHYYTTPLSKPISSTSPSSQEIPVTDTTMAMITTEGTSESGETVTTSTVPTTLSPRGNSEVVTLPPFLTLTSSSPSTMISTEAQTMPTTTQESTTLMKSTQSSETSTSLTMTEKVTMPSTMETMKTTPLTQSTESMSLTEQKTESNSMSTTSMKSTEMSTTTKTPLKDPCDDRKTLYANGMALIRVCYINESLTWPEARQKCLSINYRLFEINTSFKEISMFNYFKDFAVNNEFHWVNGIAQDSRMSTNWYVQDPYRVWNYTTNSWYGLVKAPVPGLCLGIIFVSGMPKFTEKNCNFFHSTFWCEY